MKYHCKNIHTFSSTYTYVYDTYNSMYTSKYRLIAILFLIDKIIWYLLLLTKLTKKT